MKTLEVNMQSTFRSFKMKRRYLKTRGLAQELVIKIIAALILAIIATLVLKYAERHSNWVRSTLEQLGDSLLSVRTAMEGAIDEEKVNLNRLIPIQVMAMQESTRAEQSGTRLGWKSTGLEDRILLDSLRGVASARTSVIVLDLIDLPDSITAEIHRLSRIARNAEDTKKYVLAAHTSMPRNEDAANSGCLSKDRPMYVDLKLDPANPVENVYWGHPNLKYLETMKVLRGVCLFQRLNVNRSGPPKDIVLPALSLLANALHRGAKRELVSSTETLTPMQVYYCLAERLGSETGIQEQLKKTMEYVLEGAIIECANPKSHALLIEYQQKLNTPERVHFDAYRPETDTEIPLLMQSGSFGASLAENGILLIGRKDLYAHDYLLTPAGRGIHGVDAHAAAMSNLAIVGNIESHTPRNKQNPWRKVPFIVLFALVSEAGLLITKAVTKKIKRHYAKKRKHNPTSKTIAFEAWLWSGMAKTVLTLVTIAILAGIFVWVIYGESTRAIDLGDRTAEKFFVFFLASLLLDFLAHGVAQIVHLSEWIPRAPFSWLKKQLRSAKRLKWKQAQIKERHAQGNLQR